MKKLLTISGIINLVLAGLTYLIGPLFYTNANYINIGFLAITGVIYLSYAGAKEEISAESRKFLIFIGVVNLYFNFVSGVLTLISQDKPKNNLSEKEKKSVKTVKEKIDPEKRKIDILLKLGVAMVVISGLIVATSNWESIPDILKTALLLVLALLFAGLSKFAEDKLKLKTSSFVYYFLMNFFVVFSFLSAGEFALFGPWFSAAGAGSQMFSAALFMLISLLSLILYKKYNYAWAVNASLLGIIIATSQVLKQISFPDEFILLVITVLLTIINLLSSKDSRTGLIIKKFSFILIYITAFVVTILSTEFTIAYIYIPLGIITIFNLFNHTIKTKNPVLDVVTVALIAMLPMLLIENLQLENNVDLIVNALVYTFIYLGVMTLKEPKKVFINVSSVLLNFFLLAIALAEGNSVTNALIALVILITNIFYNTFKDKFNNVPIEDKLQAVKVLVLIITGISVINEYLIPISSEISVIITTVILFVVYLLMKKEGKKLEYYIGFIIAQLIATIVCFDSGGNLELSLLLGTSLLPFASSFVTKNPRYQKTKVPMYMYFLLMMYSILYKINVFSLDDYQTLLIIIGIFGVIGVLVRKDKVLLNITKIGVLVPLKQLVETANVSYEVQMIFFSLMYLYLTYLFCSLFKNKKTQGIIGTICLSINMLMIIFSGEWITGLYIGVIALITIIIGYQKDEYKPLFVSGVIIMIVNMLYQAKNLLVEIPFWIFLLIGGLALIAFVMYKETKKNID